MPNLKSIRKRITGVKSTQQLTRAMKLVAAAKLRRAQEAILAQRPYSYALRDMIAALAARTDAGHHPLLEQRAPKNVRLLVLTSDRGLCGAFNANVCRRAEQFIREHEAHHENVGLAMIGKRGAEYFKRRPVTVHRTYLDILTRPNFAQVAQVGEEVVTDFLEHGLDAFYMVYQEFKSAAQQAVVVEQLLPIQAEKLPDASSHVDFIFEPDVQRVLDGILPLDLKIQIWRAVLESLASEMGARMTAMDAATANAGDIIAQLTLQYNKARQAAITKELMEIIGGAEAQKG